MDDADRDSLLDDFCETKGLIGQAKKYSDSMDDLRKLSEEKITVVRSCETCAHYFRRDEVCVSYGAPLLLRWLRRSIPEVFIGTWAPRIHCREWDDLELTVLLKLGSHPASIAYYRRHPDTTAPLGGRLLLSLQMLRASHLTASKPNSEA